MENLLKDMGKRIFDRRKQLNMTQETLAELLHLSSFHWFWDHCHNYSVTDSFRKLLE